MMYGMFQSSITRQPLFLFQIPTTVATADPADTSARSYLAHIRAEVLLALGWLMGGAVWGGHQLHSHTPLQERQAKAAEKNAAKDTTKERGGGRRREDSSGSDSESDSNSSDGGGRRKAPRRRVAAAVVMKNGAKVGGRKKVVGDDSSSSDESDGEDDEAKKRRERIKAKMINREREEEKKIEEIKKAEEDKRKKKVVRAPDAESSEEEEEEEESESGSGSSEEESEEEEESSSEEEKEKPKITFVPKSKRGTIAAAEKAARAEEAKEKKKEEEKKMKAMETQIAVAEVLRMEREGEDKDVTEEQTDLAGIPQVDEEDDKFPYVESEGYRMWEEREIMRLVDEALEKSKAKNEIRMKEEKKRMAKMTDRERMDEDETLMENAKRQGKDKKGEGGPKFLQRYQHKGAFYMDEDKMDADDVRLKDYHLQASGDSANVDVKKLPKVMQVRNFGRKGQSKYSTIKEQDTSGDGGMAYRGMEASKGRKRKIEE